MTDSTSSRVCPVCGSVDSLERISAFDEEGIEGWACDACGYWWMHDWDEPPAPDDDPFLRGDYKPGEALAEARAEWANRLGRSKDTT